MGRPQSRILDLVKDLLSGNDATYHKYDDVKTLIDSYLEKFKDRCPEELKLESVTLDRDPSPLLMAIGASAQKSETINPKSEVSNSAQPTMSSVFAGKPFKRLILWPLTSWAKRRVRDRENLRFERTRIFGRARRILRGIGSQLYASGKLDDPEDIFFLTIQEILGVIEGFCR